MCFLTEIQANFKKNSRFAKRLILFLVLGELLEECATVVHLPFPRPRQDIRCPGG